MRRPESQVTKPDGCQPDGWEGGGRWEKREKDGVGEGVGGGEINSLEIRAWTKPEGCWVVASVIRSNRSMRAGWAVIQPRRQPGATVFEKVSRRTTRPSVSRGVKDGVRESRKGKPEDGVVTVEREERGGGGRPRDSASRELASGNWRYQ